MTQKRQETFLRDASAFVMFIKQILLTFLGDRGREGAGGGGVASTQNRNTKPQKKCLSGI